MDSSNNSHSKKGLTNLVIAVFGGYIVVAGLVGSALMMRAPDRDITASTPKKQNTEQGVTPQKVEKTPPPMTMVMDADNVSANPKITQGRAAIKPASTSGLVGRQPKTRQTNQKPYSRQFDPKILEAARSRAAEKIGDLRGSMEETGKTALTALPEEKPRRQAAPGNFRTTTRTVRPGNGTTGAAKPNGKPQNKAASKPVFVQRPAWQPENNNSETLPPIVENDFNPGIDPVLTGSIR